MNAEKYIKVISEKTEKYVDNSNLIKVYNSIKIVQQAPRTKKSYIVRELCGNILVDIQYLSKSARECFKDYT